MKLKKYLIIPFVLALFAFILYLYANKLAISHDLNQQISQDYSKYKPKDHYRIIVEHKGNLGEKEFANRMLIAGKRLGWQVEVMENIQTQESAEKVKLIKPDFIITLNTKGIETDRKSSFPHYIWLSLGVNDNFKTSWYYPQPRIKKNRRNLINYDGYLVSFDNVTPLKNYVLSNNKKYYSIPFYPYYPEIKTNFDVDKFNNPRIFFSGANWDKLRKSKEYYQIYQMLADAGYADFYGPKESWEFIGNSYKGLIPFEGEAYINTIKKYAVALLLHSDKHLRDGIPSSRIFESAAAGNLIICDQNQFVKKYFADSVFYINTFDKPKNVYNEINQLMQWIKNHPQQAMEKAKKSYQIFKDNFTLEQAMLNIASMHEYILNDRKN